MIRIFRPAFTLVVLFTLLTGLAYPLAITGLASLAMPHQAEGSLIRMNGKVLGSELLGQAFASNTYFWPRPSATGGTPYNAAASSGTNLGPTSQKLKDMVAAEVARLKAAGVTGRVAADSATSSGSGLDPDISPANAESQIARVAAARKLPLEEVKSLVASHVQGRFAGLVGEPRVNVLALNIALDSLKPQE